MRDQRFDVHNRAFLWKRRSLRRAFAFFV
jgi:hypothetical protein